MILWRFQNKFTASRTQNKAKLTYSWTVQVTKIRTGHQIPSSLWNTKTQTKRKQNNCYLLLEWTEFWLEKLLQTDNLSKTTKTISKHTEKAAKGQLNNNTMNHNAKYWFPTPETTEDPPKLTGIEKRIHEDFIRFKKRESIRPLVHSCNPLIATEV